MVIQTLEYGVLVTIGYHPRIIEAMKKIGGGRWNPELKAWLFPPTKLGALRDSRLPSVRASSRSEGSE